MDAFNKKIIQNFTNKRLLTINLKEMKVCIYLQKSVKCVKKIIEKLSK